MRVLRAGATNHYLFHQPHLQRADGIEAIYKIVGIPMRGGVAQRAEWIECLDRFLGFLRAVHALRLINDYDRVRSLNEFNRLTPLQPISLLVDDVGFPFCIRAREILSERVDVDNKNLNRVADGELSELRNSLRVINKVLEFHISVERAEMLGSDFDIL